MNIQYSANTYTFVSYLKYQQRKYESSRSIVPVQKPVIPISNDSFTMDTLFEDDNEFILYSDYDDDDNVENYNENHSGNEFSAYQLNKKNEDTPELNINISIIYGKNSASLLHQVSKST